LNTRAHRVQKKASTSWGSGDRFLHKGKPSNLPSEILLLGSLVHLWISKKDFEEAVGKRNPSPLLEKKGKRHFRGHLGKKLEVRGEEELSPLKKENSLVEKGARRHRNTFRAIKVVQRVFPQKKQALEKLRIRRQEYRVSPPRERDKKPLTRGGGKK